MNRIQEAIEAFKNGEMLIVMDDEDRENEGDLVYAGIFSTPEKVNFLAQVPIIRLSQFQSMQKRQAQGFQPMSEI